MATDPGQLVFWGPKIGLAGNNRLTVDQTEDLSLTRAHVSLSVSIHMLQVITYQFFQSEAGCRILIMFLLHVVSKISGKFFFLVWDLYLSTSQRKTATTAAAAPIADTHTLVSERQCWWSLVGRRYHGQPSRRRTTDAKHLHALSLNIAGAASSSRFTPLLLTPRHTCQWRGLANRRKINSSSSSSPWCFKFYVQLPSSSCTILLIEK
jgi:hypothetical protein